MAEAGKCEAVGFEHDSNRLYFQPLFDNTAWDIAYDGNDFGDGGRCIGNIKGLLGGRVKPYGRLMALFAAGCAPLRGPSFRLDRPDGRKRVF